MAREEWECKKNRQWKTNILITRNIFEEKKERQYVSCQPQGLCSLAVRIHQHLVLHSHPLFFTISFYLHPFSFHQINTWNYLLTLSFLPYSSSIFILPFFLFVKFCNFEHSSYWLLTLRVLQLLIAWLSSTSSSVEICQNLLQFVKRSAKQALCTNSKEQKSQFVRHHFKFKIE